MTDITYYNRLEARPRENDFTRNLAAEVRDPLWFLSRQWQVGEFQGDDSGSPAYITYSGTASPMPRWVKNGDEVDFDSSAPLEKVTLVEPFEPDLSTRVELGQDFTDLLRAELDDTTANAIIAAFLALTDPSDSHHIYQIQAPPTDVELDPVDPATQRFLMVCAKTPLDGYELYQLARDIASGGSLPDGIATDDTTRGQIEDALAALLGRANDVFGALGKEDPATWQPKRLEYQLSVIGVDPSGKGNATLAANPDSDGEFEWYSFDVAAKNESATEAAPETKDFVTLPNRVRFPGMPSPRFWNFEDNSLSLPDISANTDDLLKLVTIDFLLVHSNDWYRIPYPQKPGTLARTKHILVTDVFGRLTVVTRADSDAADAGANRWTLFSISDNSQGAVSPIADYFVLPPSAGPAMKLGSVLEDVRFGRDEMANMAWGIERVTTSPIGEQRSGRARDAEIDANRNPPPPAATNNDFPLRYLIENEVPANFIPLLPMLENPGTSDPSIVLRRGEAFKATTNDGAQAVPSLSVILNPPSLATTDYDIAEEEIPRSGLRVERVVYRTRWFDGTTHLWVQRRRQIGAGEAQSGLKFDQALPNEV